MSEEEANVIVDEYVECAPCGLSISGMNKIMDAFVRSKYFKALKSCL